MCECDSVVVSHDVELKCGVLVMYIVKSCVSGKKVEVDKVSTILMLPRLKIGIAVLLLSLY